MVPAAAAIDHAGADRKPFPMQDEYWMIVSGCWKQLMETQGSLMSFEMTRDLDKNDSTTPSKFWHR
jgi:hypothetical protein